MVHGFDTPLDKQDSFDRLVAREAPLLKELGLRLQVVKTNLKEVNLQNWQDSFLAQLASCLHNYSHEFRYGLAGSAEPYDALVLPWGQNPCTDYLLSGSSFSLVHDGAGFSRTEKVAAIAKHPIARKVVKVCWEGRDPASNCGVCEKCVRTHLNFLAAGYPSPECFERPFNLADLQSIRLDNPAKFNELALILTYAEKKQVIGDWVPALKKKLKNPLQQPSPKIFDQLQNVVGHLQRGEFKELAGKIARKLDSTKQ